MRQTHVRESYRGRIFSAEFAGMTASFALAGLLAGLAYDRIGEWQLVIYAISASVLLAALCWMFGGRHEFRATLRSSESE